MMALALSAVEDVAGEGLTSEAAEGLAVTAELGAGLSAEGLSCFAGTLDARASGLGAGSSRQPAKSAVNKIAEPMVLRSRKFVGISGTLGEQTRPEQRRHAWFFLFAPCWC